MKEIKKTIIFLSFSLWLFFCLLLSVLSEWRLVDRFLVSPFPFINGFIENVLVPFFAAIFLLFLNPVFKYFGLDLEILYIRVIMHTLDSFVLLLWITVVGLFIYLFFRIVTKKKVCFKQHGSL